MKYILVAMVLVGCGSEPIVVATAPVNVEAETPVVTTTPAPKASPSPVAETPSLTQNETTEIVEIPAVTEETEEEPTVEPVTEEEPAYDDSTMWTNGNKVWTYAGTGGHDQGPVICDTRHFANVNELREAIDAGLLEHFPPASDPARIWAFGAQFHLDGTLVTIADGYAPLDTQLHIFCWTNK